MVEIKPEETELKKVHTKKYLFSFVRTVNYESEKKMIHVPIFTPNDPVIYKYFSGEHFINLKSKLDFFSMKTMS